MASRKIDEERIKQYFEHVIGSELRNKPQRASFAAYAMGILGEGARKSCEPIAERAASGGTEEERCENASRGHDRLIHFLARSEWDDEAVRLAAAMYAIEEFEKVEPVTTWIVDDTGFPKQGTHSVGVQRQYSGTLGKRGNCQIGVSLSVATSTEQLPIDFDLYLPKSWMDNPRRRLAARIPESAVFRTKIQMAIDMIEQAKEQGLPGDIVLADAAYGVSVLFREAVRCAGMDFGVAVRATTRVWMLDSLGRRRDDPVRVDALAASLGHSAFRKVTWRDGTKRRMSSRFCFRRVKVEQDDGQTTAEREEVWLVIEWPENEAAATKFLVTSLRRRMSKKQIVRILMERWRTEQAYQEMKGELGLDHFEGRSYPGWNHHISVVLSCYAFVVAERRRLFPPSDAEAAARALGRAARAPLRGLVRDGAARDRSDHAQLVAAVSHLSQAECAQ